MTFSPDECELRLQKAVSLLDPDGKHNQLELISQIQEIADDFRQELDDASAAHTFAVAKTEFDYAHTEARRLRRRLSNLEHDLPIIATRLRLPLDQRSEIGRTIRADLFDLMGPLAEFIRALDRFAEHWPKVDGRLDLHTIHNANPKRVLAVDCYTLFSELRPGEAKTTPGGDYYQFTALVYELGTGQGAESKGAGLSAHVAKVAAHYNKAGPLNHRWNQLRRRRRAGSLSPEETTSLDGEEASLKEQLRSLGSPYTS